MSSNPPAMGTLCAHVLARPARPSGRQGRADRRHQAYKYAACADCTRLRALRLYRRLNTLTSLAFLSQIVQAFPFPIRKLQTDRGIEFPFTFLLAVERRGIRHRYIQPRRPDQNGKVERSHRVDAEEFWGRATFATFGVAEAALRAWERDYNEVRFSMRFRAGHRPRNSRPSSGPRPSATRLSARSGSESVHGRGP